MTAAILCMVVMCSPLTVETYATWSDLAADYPLPAVVVTVEPLGSGPDDGLAAQTGIDAQGRAMVTIDPRLALETTHIRRKVIAHEAFHAMMRARGAPYMGLWEENLANNFAYCWTDEPYYTPDVPCAAMLAPVW